MMGRQAQEFEELVDKLWIERKKGIKSPAGKNDKAGRWHPDADERQDCCAEIREPSRAWPSSLYRHCCTYKHCRKLAESMGITEFKMWCERHGINSENVHWPKEV